MRSTREVLRQKWGLGRPHRDVAASVGLGIGTITSLVQRAAAAGLTWEQAEGLTDEELEARVYGPRAAPPSTRALPDPEALHVALKRPGVTLALLHAEYLESHPDGYQYTQFREHYHRWERRQRLVLRQTYRGGEKGFVDYAGQHACYALAGIEVTCELFVAVLGASNYTYAEATHTQRLPDWIESHVRAFAFFGGVPQVTVPDQLKSAVTLADRYEPGVNRTYAELARHYGTCIVPARPAKPRDKAKVEAGVLVAERWILARLRDERPGSLRALNERIAVLVADLNDRPLKGLGVSRRTLFERVERPFLKPLPLEPFEYGEWKPVKVSIDYHVEVARHYYSVPFSLVGQTLEARVTGRTVELFSRGQRVALHARSGEAGRHTTVPAHMPAAHRAHAGWSPTRLIAWGATIGPKAGAFVEALVRERPHPEQGYRSCLGLMRLAKRDGAQRLEAACGRALAGGARSYRHVEAILRAGLDRMPLTEEARPGPAPAAHVHVRGPGYYTT